MSWFWIWIWVSASVACVVNFRKSSAFPDKGSNKITSSIGVAIVGPLVLPAITFSTILLLAEKLVKERK
jgi:hypothetical protein